MPKLSVRDRPACGLGRAEPQLPPVLMSPPDAGTTPGTRGERGVSIGQRRQLSKTFDRSEMPARMPAGKPWTGRREWRREAASQWEYIGKARHIEMQKGRGKEEEEERSLT